MLLEVLLVVLILLLDTVTWWQEIRHHFTCSTTTITSIKLIELNLNVTILNVTNRSWPIIIILVLQLAATAIHLILLHIKTDLITIACVKKEATQVHRRALLVFFGSARCTFVMLIQFLMLTIVI